MNVQHTPGPWKAQPGENFVTDGRDIVICEMHRHHTDEQVKANARLIAAAPDLLVSLQALFALPEYDGTKVTSLHRISVKEKVRAAISKATVGQP